MRNELIDIINGNSKQTDNNFHYFTDDDMLIDSKAVYKIVDEIELLFKKKLAVLETKILVYETFIDKSNFKAFTKKESKKNDRR